MSSVKTHCSSGSAVVIVIVVVVKNPSVLLMVVVVVVVSLFMTAVDAGATARHQAMAGKLMTDEHTQTSAMKQAALFGVIRPG